MTASEKSIKNITKGYTTSGPVVETLWWDVKLGLYWLLFITIAFFSYASIISINPQILSDHQVAPDRIFIIAFFIVFGWLIFLVNARVVRLGTDWICVPSILHVGSRETRIPFKLIKSITITLPKQRGDGQPVLCIVVQDVVVSYTLHISKETSTRLQNLLKEEGIKVIID